MAITNLTGTKWRFFDAVTANGMNYYSINFTTKDGHQYNGINIMFGMMYYEAVGSSSLVYVGNWIAEESGLNNDDVKEISITGGSDATNSFLIEWLSENAVEVKAVLELGPFLSEIADAIRYKKGTTEPINAQDFAFEIKKWTPPTMSMTITPNFNYQSIYPDEGYYLSYVDIEPIPSDYVKPEGTLGIGADGEYDVKSYEKVNVSTGGSGNTLQILLNATKSAYRLFYNYIGNSVDGLISKTETANVEVFTEMFYASMVQTIPEINTEEGKNFNGMFYGCTSLTSVPSLNLKKGTSFKQMFYSCSKLQSLNLSFGTLSKNTYEYAFYSCKLLEDPIKLDMSGTPSIAHTFQNCYKLKAADISFYPVGMTTSKTDYAWNNCYSLRALILRNTTSSSVDLNFGNYMLSNCYHMYGTTDPTYNPTGARDGYVYVPRDRISLLQNATNWCDLQFRALEDYTVDGTTTGEFNYTKAGL